MLELLKSSFYNFIFNNNNFNVEVSISCFLLVITLITSERLLLLKMKALSKTLASLSFIYISFKALQLKQIENLSIESPNLYIFIGLILGAIGDICLLSTLNGFFFHVGAYSFLIGHIAYTYAFYINQFGIDFNYTFISFILCSIWCISAFIFIKKFGKIEPELLFTVIAYLIIISIMTGVAAGTIKTVKQGPIWFIAALLFFFSDGCVAYERFVKSSFTSRLIGLPLYYGAQIIFANSLYYQIESN
eukprot:TRINITY_DN312_c3_g1_i1.p1 TRINITY_DN312_c3_g1~~TRINITY_DN312_c3_g1_i1.p1  ORF type:complete len:247 (-),score=90.99 TRINITY_DN312_c3_g1_i1:26-766(-)